MRKELLIKIIVSFGMIFMISTRTALSRDMTVESRWAAEPVTLDGVNKEWPVETLEMFESAKVQFSFRNDRENLFVFLSFTDPKFVSSLKETGISVYINTKGKKKKDDGFLFRTFIITAQEVIRLWEKKGRVLNEIEKQEILSRPQYMQHIVQLIRNKKKQDFPPDEGTSATHPIFWNTENSSLPIYELQIPLSSIGLKNDSTGTPGQIIKIGFEWGGLTDKKRQDLMTRRADEAMENNAEVDDSNNRLQAPEFLGGPKEYSFWVDLKLASPPKAP